MTELKPCPFCGGEGQATHWYPLGKPIAQYGCQPCNLWTGDIKSWNARATPADHSVPVAIYQRQIAGSWAKGWTDISKEEYDKKLYPLRTYRIVYAQAPQNAADRSDTLTYEEAQKSNVVLDEALADFCKTVDDNPGLTLTQRRKIAAEIRAEYLATVELTPAQIRDGWQQTFSTNNPFCPCDLKTFTKAVRWAEHAVNKAHTK